MDKKERWEILRHFGHEELSHANLRNLASEEKIAELLAGGYIFHSGDTEAVPGAPAQKKYALANKGRADINPN